MSDTLERIAMDNIRIGKVIAAKRKEKRVTQEELANHLGISKPAVSKWESGQSYPDILLLPVLAAYFDISVDELLGYEPQMEKEDIRKLCKRIEDEFSKETFEKSYEECQGYIKKYYSCWQLQMQMGLLIINNASLAESAERMEEVIREVLSLFDRIENNAEDVNLARQALHLKALCHLMLSEPEEAINLLEDINTPIMQTEVALVRAYQMKGDRDKALEYLQGHVYVNLVTIIGAAPDFFRMYTDNPEKLDMFFDIYMELCRIFEVEQLHPAILLQLYLSSSLAYVARGEKDKAIDILEKYTELLIKTEKDSFTLKGNRIFDALEKYFEEVDIEVKAPRKSRNIWNDLKKAVVENPMLEPLITEERYILLTQRLKHN